MALLYWSERRGATGENTDNFLAMPKIRKADITLRERVTLTWLIYRNRFKAASVSWLSNKSYFDRKTIRKHLKNIGREGICCQD